METKSIAWQTGSGNITLTYQGQGDGTISVQSDANDIGNARSQVITIETTEGSPVITKNFTISQAACPFPVGDVKNYSYTGSYQEVELPAGQYKLQCWGAQGGSNAAASSYGITAKAGGKGGYSEGIITLSTKTTVRVYVGGQGTSSSGGYNGGGSTTGSSTYNASDEQGVSRMGGGGGATDIRLSDGNLLSRMIVAGGGSGGAMCCKQVTTTTTSWQNLGTTNSLDEWASDGKYYRIAGLRSFSLSAGNVIRFKVNTNNSGDSCIFAYYWMYSGGGEYGPVTYTPNTWIQKTLPSGYDNLRIHITAKNSGVHVSSFTVDVELQVTSTSTTTTNESQVGFVGGGTTGGGNSTYQGKQNAAGTGGSFGQGANQNASNYRYCSGAGGGGWYGGGGGQYNDNSMGYCKYSGGGSGWVNTYANRGNRPSGYTGLQLDSGSTTAGDSSFPAPSGGNETGHAGNGYVRITRLS